MRTLNLDDLMQVSGAGKYSCSFEDYHPEYYVMPPMKEEPDYGILAISVANAAIFGCLGGLKGGPAGCAGGALLGATGTMVSFLTIEAYKMYQDGK